MLERLEIFLKEGLGNAYGVSTMDFIKGVRHMSIAPKNGKYIDKDRTFFCSELVAKIYKVLGVMANDERGSKSYYP